MERYIIKFSKGKGIKFISHLDLMRSFERAIRRTNIPVTYSKGFNPHMELSFATPLAVGVWSGGEYMELKLDTEMDGEEIKYELNNTLPYDLRIHSIKKADDYYSSLMSIVDAASYEITLVNLKEIKLGESNISEFLDKESIKVEKQGKNGIRTVDIKPMIYDLKFINAFEETSIIFVLAACGSKMNLNPELLVQALKTSLSENCDVEIRDIYKNETYLKREGLFITPMEI